ncbi:zinc finger protein 773 [Aedes albopictus]|uniref:C2H2-type domain-containing protein n=1 Tax=Aedes albopictus TaxID=7160 RepID=A0ABM1Y8J2_AEDAL|nr:zinc finger protein 773-like [Aedes albopictus]
MAFQVFIKTEQDPLPIEARIKIEDEEDATYSLPVEPDIKVEEPPDVVEPEAGPSALTTAKKPHLKPVKTKMCIRKSDMRQCRLCLRVLAREDVRETTTPGSDFRRKIMDAVGVKITAEDKLRTVCINCLLVVDMIYDFRAACNKANTLHAIKLLMMHPGSWMSEENKTTIEACHRALKRNRAEMDGLFNCSWVGGNAGKKFRTTQKEVVLDSGDAPKVGKGELSDSDPEMSEEFGKQVDQQMRHQDSIDASSDDEKTKPAPPRVKKDSTTRFMCDICGSLVLNNNAEHHKNMHLGVRPYSCDLEGCDATFHSLRAKRKHCTSKGQHISTAEQEKQIKCELCHRMVKSKNMRSHMWAQHSNKSIHPLKTQCKICEKYYYKIYIKDHMATHTGELPHKCEFCGRGFAAYNNLVIHRRKYHSEQLGLT